MTAWEQSDAGRVVAAVAADPATLAMLVEQINADPHADVETKRRLRNRIDQAQQKMRG